MAVNPAISSGTVLDIGALTSAAESYTGGTVRRVRNWDIADNTPREDRTSQDSSGKLRRLAGLRSAQLVFSLAFDLSDVEASTFTFAELVASFWAGEKRWIKLTTPSQGSSGTPKVEITFKGSFSRVSFSAPLGRFIEAEVTIQACPLLVNATTRRDIGYSQVA